MTQTQLAFKFGPEDEEKEEGTGTEESQGEQEEAPDKEVGPEE